MEKYKYRHFLTCCIAGLAYHDADSIMDELQEGDKVVLVRQKDNRYDSNAVAVTLPDGYNGNPDEFDFDNILGYIPRECNAQLATMLDMGWTDLLNAEIMEIKHHAAYTDRIRIAVYIRSKEQHSIPGRPLWAIEFNHEGFMDFQALLHREGFAFYLWDGKQPKDSYRPKRGDEIVVIYRGRNRVTLYLLKSMVPTGNNIDQDSSIDDENAYRLCSIAGPIAVNHQEIKFLDDERLEKEPNHPLSSYATTQLWHLLEKACELDTPATTTSSIGERKEGKEPMQTWYVRCHEIDGSDYLYQTCSSREGAQAIVDGQDSKDALYEHLYVTDKIIEDKDTE